MGLRTGLKLRLDLRLRPRLRLRLLPVLRRPVFVRPIDARRSLVASVGRVVRVWARARRLATGPWRRITPAPRVIPVIAVVVTSPAAIAIILIIAKREGITRVGVPGSVTAGPRIVVVIGVAVAIGFVSAGEALVR